MVRTTEKANELHLKFSQCVLECRLISEHLSLLHFKDPMTAY